MLHWQNEIGLSNMAGYRSIGACKPSGMLKYGGTLCFLNNNKVVIATSQWLFKTA